MRRSRPEKREIVPDMKYNNTSISMFVARLLKNGKRSVALTIMYDALTMVQEKTGKNPVDVMEQALKNVGPLMEVRPRRVGGATYQVPMEVPTERRLTLAMRWILDSSRARTGKSFAEKLSAELMDAASGQGSAVRKREESHKMAEANRAFSHYRM
ncbi:MAG: 30S ribosomal protein S7 [Anaerolineaceae bacterium]|jgi:small subunit ribosomal protein S7|nr:30S ribosomal protein S7 [Anaerolineaceae bacterium]NTV35754.1 30S ribosomal protein S7 [Anaerolineaceae bacterium]